MLPTRVFSRMQNLEHFHYNIMIPSPFFFFPTQNSNDSVTDEASSTSWSFGLNTAGVVIVYSLLLIFALKTVHRNSEWQNKETLARSGLKVNPTNAKIHVMLGNVLAQKVSLMLRVKYLLH